MQRSHLLRWLALAIGLLGTQCLDSISDDCTKTLTCEDDQQPTLRRNCEWRYPNGTLWAGAPRYDEATRKWRWPDGKETATQDFACDLGDAGTDAGPAGPDCRVNITCDEGQVCDPATGACVECAADIDCAGNMPMGDAGAARVCDTASHRCVECLVNQNCSGDTSVCKVDPANSRRNACVECTDSTTCTNPAEPICDDLGALLDRFRGYGPRLTEALERVRAGDVDWFTKPMIASYHTVWFEMHEDLLCTLGIERGAEGEP